MDIAQRRNLAVVGLHHAGKTTLTEAILFHCGAVARRGAVADGTATTDYEPECIGHAQSTSVGFAHARGGDVELILTDAPGFVDFLEETKIALLGADAAVVVVDADPARIPHTRALIDFIESRKLPHMFFVNKLDRPGANPGATLDALVAAYGMHVVAEQVPIGDGESFTGVKDVVRDTGAGDGTVAAAHGKLLEALGDFDDHLLEELLDGKEPPIEEVRKDLHDEYARDQIVPVLFGAAARGIGIAELIAAIVDQFPSPLDVEHIDAGGRAIEVKPAGPVVAQVVKTIVHPQSGKLSVARVLTGTLTGDSVLTDTSRPGVQARPGGIYRLQGKKQEAVTSAGPGELVALARLDAVHTLDTLTTGGIRTVMPGIALQEPVFAVAIAPRERLDDAKLSQMLARLVDEDPTLRLTRAEFTNELQLCGNGEVHVGIAAERLARKYHVAVETRPPQIAYRETITAGTEAHARYKHQTGGHGQFGEVRLRIAPRERGNGVTFDTQVVGGAVPRQFFPAVEKGVREALARGVAGFPVTDLNVTLYDGSFHDVDSSEASFKTAASMAIRDALPKCAPQLLEPVLAIEVLVPEPFASTIVAQLTAKRGIVQSFGPTENATAYRVAALVPQAELATYITELRTATQGLGSFTSRHERFDPVPPKIVEGIRAPVAV